MITVTGWCAGQEVFRNTVVDVPELEMYLAAMRSKLRRNEFTFSYGMMPDRVATEVCVDVYSGAKELQNYCGDLSRSWKNTGQG